MQDIQLTHDAGHSATVPVQVLVVPVVQFGQVIPHLKALGLLILIISVLDQFHDVASFYRTSCKKDCCNWSYSHVVPVRAGKVIIACKYFKSPILNLSCRKPEHSTLLCDLLTT